MAKDKPAVSVREHADKVINDLFKDRPPDPDAVRIAASMPVFSEGTKPLDPNSGKPIDLETPEFAEQGPAIETTQGPGANGQTAEQLAATRREAQPPAPETPAVAAQVGSEPPKPPAVEAAAQAAETVAASIWDDLEELEIDDPDLDTKIPLRVPKKFAETVKRGYNRRAALDRSMRNLRDAEAALRPMIEDGRLQQILPLIQRANQDAAYAEYVWGGYQRALRGLPLIEQARQEAAAAGAAATAQPEETAALDPLFADVIAPYQRQTAALEQRLNTWEQQRQAEVAQQQENQRIQQWTQGQYNQAYRDLIDLYPGLYSGDPQRDSAIWTRTLQTMKDGGYIERGYNIVGGMVRAGGLLYGIEQERLAATASPAATALQQSEQRLLSQAQQQAAAAARTVGSGAPTPQQPPAPPRMPDTMLPNGKRKPADQYMAELQAAIAAGARA